MIIVEKLSFTYSLLNLNKLNADDFRNWSFEPGMGFADHQKWWEKGDRVRPHEGVDISLYEDKRGARHVLSEKTKVPFFLSGRVVAICNDFLGKTVFVHGNCRDYGEVIAAHAHILPAVVPGRIVTAGEIAGRFAPANSKVPAHFHLSLIRFPPACSLTELDWNFLNTCDQGLFLEPILF